MKRPTGSHISALIRSIESKQTAIGSRHIPPDILKDIECDIDLLKEVIIHIYAAMDKVSLYD